MRVRDSSRAAVLHALDLGARGIIPDVQSVEEARRLVEYAKYYPLGARGVKTPGKAGGLKRGNRSKRFLLFAYGELQQLKLLHLPVFFFLVPYVEPNFPFSYSYRAYKISSRPETRSCYFTNFFKMFRYLNSAFSF